MSIPASHIVSVSSRVLSGGASDLETNGMLLTKSTLIPSGQPAMLFGSAAEVADMFGAQSVEASFAQQYFTGVTNQQRAVRTLVIGRRVAEDAPAWIRGGAVSVDLEGFKTVTDGVMAITINGEAKTVSALDLSGATSLSEVAEMVATAIGGVTGSYDSELSMFTFTTETAGVDATVDFAEAGEGGTNLSEMLCLTQAEGAVLSQGMNAQTEAETMNAICTVTRNWVGFTTAWEATLEEVEALAAWTDGTGDDYVYAPWSTDENMCNQLTQGSTIAAQIVDKYNCTGMVYGGLQYAAFVLAVGASIAWNRTQGMKVWFAKSASGMSPNVVEESVANALEAIRVSYFGAFATRNDEFQFFNRGTLASDFYGFFDVLYGSIYLRNAIQVSCMSGFERTNRQPYNAHGEALIRAWCQDPINRCKENGVIDEGLELNESQKAQLMQELGDDAETAIQDLATKGYWLGVSMPDAAGRVDREAPAVTIVYAYAGSVQSLECAITTVL